MLGAPGGPRSHHENWQDQVAADVQEALMPGKPGTGSPVPKPAAQRRRRNKADVPVQTVPSGALGHLAPGERPTPTRGWHPIAREWFESLAASGQARFYEPSDWAMARLGGEMMSKLCAADRPSAQLLASVLAITSSLLATEGDRRRLRIELARSVIDEDEQASVTALADYQRRLGG